MRFFGTFSLKGKIRSVFSLVSLLTVAAFTVQAALTARDDALRAVDEKLVMAARATAFQLGAGYHDDLKPRDAVDLVRKRQESVMLTEQVKFLNVDFVYTMFVREGKVVYSQASLSDEQLADKTYDFYLQPSDVPKSVPVVIEALKTQTTQFDTAVDEQYGYLRSAIVPITSPGGFSYVACADINAASVDAAVRQATLRALAVGAVVLVFALAISIWLGSLIANPIQRLIGILRQSLTTGSGDLTVTLPVESRDEIGQLAENFNSFMANLRGMLVTVRDDALSLTSGMDRISEMANKLASDADRQSEMAASTAATVEEITTSISQNASSTQDVGRAVRKAGEDSDASATAVLNVANEIGRVAASVDQLSGVMNELDQRSHDINGIVKVIKEIADQTNLLALNAAIEAARAGEQGRGFAVVADEVRKLAERTAKATVEIGGMIDAMRRESLNAVSRMSATHDEVTQSVTMAKAASQHIRTISKQTGIVVGRVQEIALSTNEQSMAATVMAQSAEKLSLMAEEGSAAISETRSVIDGINTLARSLREMVESFKL